MNSAPAPAPSASASSSPAPVEAPWALSTGDAAAAIGASLSDGLSADEAQRRLEQYGPNEIAEERGRTAWQLFFAQFVDLMIGLLAAAALISVVIGEWTDAILIALIVVANAVVGFLQEWRAEQAVAALKQMTQPEARVRRGGTLQSIPSTQLVPGDLIEVKAGDFVPADARLAEGVELEVNESALTGESLPVTKSPDPVDAATGLPDRTDMMHSGTSVVRGRGVAVVITTGMQTELGRIATLLATAESVPTPLQQRLASLSRRLALIVSVVAVLIFAIGVFREDRADWNRQLVTTMLLTAVSLAVAAIPEGLPAVVTVTLALGSRRMSSRNAIVRRLAAVETLGAVNVICSDKTGTLTQNRMTAADWLPASDEAEIADGFLRGAALCNDAELHGDGGIVGSPTEKAILEAAAARGVDPAALRRECPRVAEIPFSSDRKFMATLHRHDGESRRVYVKGAVERILEMCGSGEPVSQAGRRSQELAAQGRRVLAVAALDWNSDQLPENGEFGQPLQYLGMVGIVDPIRPEARDAIARCRSAGIRPVMITGDHQTTAEAIAGELQLREEGDETMDGVALESLSEEDLRTRSPRISVYARVSPEHKLKIVRAHQSRGHVVAMTGDGVNDAPALKQADIGVAMGIAGTDVAKESAEMILADDNFATIVAAVEEGRVVYDNIRKFVLYLLATNAGEVFVLFAAVLLGWPIPLLPVHLLWINLVTDGLPALALGFEPAEPDIMRRKPRRREESLFAGGLGWAILVIGLLMAVGCLGLYAWRLPDDPHAAGLMSPNDPDNPLARSRTLVFLTLSLFQLFHVLSVRSSSQLYFQMKSWTNPRLSAAVALGVVLQFAIIYLPGVRGLFHAVPLTAAEVAAGVAVSLSVFVVAEVWKVVQLRYTE